MVHQFPVDIALRNNNHCADQLGGAHEAGPHLFVEHAEWQLVEDEWDRDFNEWRRFRPQFAVRSEIELRELATYVNRGAYVFAAVNSVAGGPNNFRHIRPHRVETRTGEWPAVSRAGDGNLAGCGLIP